MSKSHTDSGLLVYVQPDELWAFFMLNKEKLRDEMCLVAENEETGYELRLDIEGDYPLLRVYYKGEAEYGQYIYTRRDAPSVMRGLVLSRLCPVIEESDIPDDQGDAAETDRPDEGDEDFNEICDGMINMREETLLWATGDFLATLLNNGHSDDLYQGDIPEAVLDSVCKMLARRFKISVFRPTWVPVGKTEEENYVEYPYLDTDKPGVIVGEPNSYEDVIDYIDTQYDDDDDDDIPEEPDDDDQDDDQDDGEARDDFPVS